MEIAATTASPSVASPSASARRARSACRYFSRSADSLPISCCSFLRSRQFFFDVGLSLLGGELSQRVGQFRFFHLRENLRIFDVRVDDTAKAIGVGFAGLDPAPTRQHACTQRQCVLILHRLVASVALTHIFGTVPQIRPIQFRVELDDDLILRTVDVDDLAILVDVEELAFGQLRTVPPLAANACLMRAAVNRC